MKSVKAFLRDRNRKSRERERTKENAVVCECLKAYLEDNSLLYGTGITSDFLPPRL